MRRFAPIALLCATVLAACGGDGGGKGRGVTLHPGEALRVTAREYSFDPSDVTARAGTRLRIVLDNRGSLAHDLRVLQGDRDVGGTPTFMGGPPRSAAVALPAGTYRMVCTVGDHEQLGMHATLRVRG